MSDQFSKQLVSMMNERFSDDSLEMPMSEWICKNTSLKKRPFSFKGYGFQRQMADDMHPDMNVIKISQVGLTELQMRKALGFLVRNRGTSLIFSLPTEDMYKRVSKARINPMIATEKVFNTPEDVANKSVRSEGMKQFGESFLYLVPAIEQAATSIDADFVMNDEIDLSDQKMISLFQSRLQGSQHKISQKFSTPTFPAYGIDSNWNISDQHFYVCKCDACNHINMPEFDRRFIHLPGLPDNIENLTSITVEYQDKLDFDNSYVKCEKCHARLDLDNDDQRFWLSKYPSKKETRGYRVGPFSTGSLTIRYIFKSLWNYQKAFFERGFHNTVLGIPFSDGSIQIPIEDINECFTDQMIARDLSEYPNLWVGVDVGQICYVTIGSGTSKEDMDIVSVYPMKVDLLVDHLVSMCENYNVRFGCIDRHPYEPTAREIYKKTGGKIMPVEYRGTKEVNLVYDEYQDVSHGQVNRTMFLDALASKIRQRSMNISGYGQYKQAFSEHLRDMVRDESPEKPAEWRKLQGIDHFFHSSAFMLLAPHLQTVIDYKDKSDNRSSVGIVIATPDNKHETGLIGMSSNKHLVNDDRLV